MCLYRWRKPEQNPTRVQEEHANCVQKDACRDKTQDMQAEKPQLVIILHLFLFFI